MSCLVLFSSGVSGLDVPNVCVLMTLIFFFYVVLSLLFFLQFYDGVSCDDVLLKPYLLTVQLKFG